MYMWATAQYTKYDHLHKALPHIYTIINLQPMYLDFATMLAQSARNQRISCQYCLTNHLSVGKVGLLCHQNHLICCKCVNKLNRANKQTLQCLTCHELQHVSQIRVAKINFVDVEEVPKLFNQVLIQRQQYDLDDQMLGGDTHRKMKKKTKSLSFGALYFAFLVGGYFKAEQHTFIVNCIYFLLVLDIVLSATLIFQQHILYSLYRKGHITIDYLLQQYRINKYDQSLYHSIVIVIKTIVMVVVILFGSIAPVYVMVMIGIAVSWVMRQQAKDRMEVIYQIKLQMHSH